MKKKIVLTLLIAFTTLPLFAETVAEQVKAPEIKTLKGTVSNIKNSIIFTLKDDKGAEHLVRLSQIWTPYGNKPYGKEAIAALTEIIDGKKVECTVHAKDRFGKNIAEVMCENKSVQAQMVELGLAWVHKRYNTPTLLKLQDKAKEARRGVWGLPRPPGYRASQAAKKAAKKTEAVL